MTIKFKSHMRRRFAFVLTVCQLTTFSGPLSTVCVGQETPGPTIDTAVESIPAPSAAQPSGPVFPAECQPAPTDSPLFTLNTDIRPRGQDGKTVAADQLPFNCAGVKPPEQRMMSVDLSCDSCYPGYCNILSLARFCHKPLYFNDDCVERCGCTHCCCQPAASAMCFYGRALLMPVTTFCECPCSCVASGGCCR